MVNRFFASRMLLGAWRSPSIGEAAYGCAASQVIFAPRGEMNGTQPGRQEGAGSGSGRSCGASPVGRGRRVPRAHCRTDDRAACQGASPGRVHACGQEHAGTQGARRHVVRIGGTEAQGACGARFLEGRPGRGRARGEGLRERDRKSTRLNSSHRCISYAVFCLKKKKINNTNWTCNAKNL